jgi:hypothetical protein
MAEANAKDMEKGEFHEDAEPQQLAWLLRELARDAGRYHKLRAMHWDTSPLAVVRDPKEAVKFGYLCPFGDLLDQLLDALP